jgi:hypothetical protein
VEAMAKFALMSLARLVRLDRGRMGGRYPWVP